MADPMNRRDPDDNDRRPGDLRTDPRTTRPTGGNRSNPIVPWIIGLLVVAALVIGGFFLLGGDVDTDTEGEFDVETPTADVDVDGPDVDVETPDVDIDPGSVDVEDGDAEADVDGS